MARNQPDPNAPVVDLSAELRSLAQRLEKLHQYWDPERGAAAREFIIKRLEALANHIDAGG